MNRFFISFTLLISCSLLLAQNPVDQLIQNPLLQNANISLLVRDMKTGENLYEWQPTYSRIPASTMKTVTTAAALEILGPDFRFETKIETDGKIGKDSTLNGNLYIRGGGDPTLGSEKTGDRNFLGKWVAAVRKAGINNINGSIIADPGIFDREVINPKWSWEDMGNYYAAGVHGIAYLDNTFRLYFRSGKAGTPTEIIRMEPEISELTIDNYVTSANINSDEAYFYGAPFSYNRYVTGRIPEKKDEFAVKGDIPNPALLLARHFQAQLILSGIKISDNARVESNTGFRKLAIYSHFSPPLSEIITETNVSSNNLYAEYLFKYLGVKNNQPGTNELAVKTIREFWKSKGLPVDELFQVDGSGLSAVNAVSAHFFVELLNYMQNKSKYNSVFYNSLPVSGESGTLKSFLANPPLKGKVHAKSGTIAGVKSYTGYIERPERTLVFALLINNANGTSREVTRKMEEFLENIAK